jgi:hypothetical protein
MATQHSSTRRGPRRDEVLFSDMSKLWVSVRDTVESFAETYFSPTRPARRLTAVEWMDTSADFAWRLWRLWLRGATIAGTEGYRISRATSSSSPEATIIEIEDQLERVARARARVAELEKVPHAKNTMAADLLAQAREQLGVEERRLGGMIDEDQA